MLHFGENIKRWKIWIRIDLTGLTEPLVVQPKTNVFLVINPSWITHLNRTQHHLLCPIYPRRNTHYTVDDLKYQCICLNQIHVVVAVE